MKAPGGTNTPVMPVRAFGAPQTTWIGLPSPGYVNHADAQPVGVGMLLRLGHARDHVGRQQLGLVLDALDLEPDHRELGHDLVERRVGVEMLFQPGQGELHGLSPPASVGKSSGRKP